jgi:hypothetical protein
MFEPISKALPACAGKHCQSCSDDYQRRCWSGDQQPGVRRTRRPDVGFGDCSATLDTWRCSMV